MIFTEQQVESLCKRTGTDRWKTVGIKHPQGYLFHDEDPHFTALLALAGAVVSQPATADKVSPQSDRKQRGPATPDLTIPFDQWPGWAKQLSQKATAEDKGLGDIAQRYAAKAGGEWFKKFMRAIGLNCGCVNRQKWLNERYPLSQIRPG